MRFDSVRTFTHNDGVQYTPYDDNNKTTAAAFVYVEKKYRYTGNEHASTEMEWVRVYRCECACVRACVCYVECMLQYS